MFMTKMLGMAVAVLGMFGLTGCVSVPGNDAYTPVQGRNVDVCAKGYDPYAAVDNARNRVEAEVDARRASACRDEARRCKSDAVAVQEFLNSSIYEGYYYAGKTVFICVARGTEDWQQVPPDDIRAGTPGYRDYRGRHWEERQPRGVANAIAPRQLGDNQWRFRAQVDPRYAGYRYDNNY